MHATMFSATRGLKNGRWIILRLHNVPIASVQQGAYTVINTPLDFTSNRPISQDFLQQIQGHYCSICNEQHFLTSTNLATFETAANCTHVYCYLSISRMKMLHLNNLTYPNCQCIATNIIHHTIISPSDLTMDMHTTGTFHKRYWGKVKAIFAPYVT